MPYMNPATMFGSSGLSPDSPLQGALLGMGLPYAQKFADDEIRDSDLKYLENLNKYRNDMADNPVKDADRLTKLRTADEDQRFLASGKYLDEKIGKADQTIANARKTENENEITRKGMIGNRLDELSQELKDMPLNPANPGDKDRWSFWQGEFQKLGVQMPSWPTDNDIKRIHTQAKAFMNNQELQRKLATIKETGEQGLRPHIDPRSSTSTEGRMAIEGIQGRNALLVESMRGDSRETVQNLRNQAAYKLSKNSDLIGSMLQESIQREVANGGQISETTMQRAVEWAADKVDRELAQDENYKLLMLQANAGNSEAISKASAMRAERIKQIVSALPGVSNPSKVVSTPSKPNTVSQGQPKAITSQAEYDALPKGAVYTWNGKQGKKGQ